MSGGPEAWQRAVAPATLLGRSDVVLSPEQRSAPQPVGKRTRRGPSSRHNSISMSLVLGSAGNHLDASFLPEPQFHLQDGCRDPDAACLAEALAGRADGGGVVATPLPTVPTAPPLLTMSSLPFLCRALDSATAVSTQAAKEQ